MKTNRSLNLLKTSLYLIAALAGIPGLLIGFSLLGSAANVHNILLPFQLMGGEVIANLLTPYVRGLLSGLGAVTLIGSLVLSLLLFAIGRLLGMVAAQEARLAYLEAQQVNNSALRA